MSVVIEMKCPECGSFSVPSPWPRTAGHLDGCWPCEHLSSILDEHTGPLEAQLAECRRLAKALGEGL